MEKITRLPIFVITIALLVLGSCTKEKAGSGGTGLNIDSLQEQLQYPDSLKRAVAGYDILVELPTTECVLNGGASHINWDGIAFAWRKISGPESFTLDSANASATPVRNLQEGFYQFELKVTDKTGYAVADTMRVIVGQLPETPQEKIFASLTWVSSWFNQLEIPNIYQHLAPGIFYKVYIRRGNSTDWIAVKQYNSYESSDPNQSYDYFIQGWQGDSTYNFDTLYLFYYGGDISDHPDVKILY